MNLIKYKKIHSLEENLYMESYRLENPLLLRMQVHDDVHHIEDFPKRVGCRRRSCAG